MSWRAIVVAVAAVFTGCLAPQNTLMVGVNVRGWSDAKSLAYDNQDTLSLRDMNIAIRYNSGFEQSSLPLKIGVTTPDNRYFDEIVNLRLANVRTAIAVTAVESIPYRADLLLSQKGLYTFSLEPLSEVRGVEAIGVEFVGNKD